MSVATCRITPTAYRIVTTNSLQVTNPNNMYADTDSTDAATILSLSNGRSLYLYLYGFNFSILPSDAVVQDIQIKIKGSKTASTYGSSIYAVSSVNGQSIPVVGSAPVFSSSTAVQTFGNAQGTALQQWNAIRNAGTNFGLYIDCGTSSWSQNTTSIYGAEVAITFSSQSLIPVTGVELDIHSATFEEGQSITLTPTVSPSDAADKTVTWSSSNTDIAVVNNGVVEAGFEQTGTAVITVTTNDGGFTDQCTVTVTQGQDQLFKLTPGSGLVPGEKYIIGTIDDEYYDFLALSSVSGSASRILTASHLSESDIPEVYAVDAYTASKVVFECSLMDESNPLTTVLVNRGKYLYIDSSGGLQMKEAASVDRFWHYIDEHDDGEGAFWEFRSTSSNGYTDTSSEYKNYILPDNYDIGYTDGHLTQGDPPVSQAVGYLMPPIHLLTPYTIPEKPYLKINGNWEECSGIYKKESGVWIDYSTNISAVFDPNQNYIKV